MPSIFCKGGAVRLEAPPWSQSWDETLGRTQLSTYQLRTGSKAVPKRKSFFRIVGGATGYNNLFYPDVDLGTGTYPIDPTIIKIGDLGSLSADRYLYKALPDGETHDATPKVPRRYYTHTVGFNKYRFISECHAPIPANRARTTIGVGEEVDLNFQPGLPAGIAAAWSTTAGTLSYANGPLNRLTAPERKNTATVKATIRGETCSIDFSVEEPTGINATVRGAADYFPVHPAVGAGMHMDVVLQPNAVSFYRVQVKEPGETTAGKEGYFTVHEPPSHSGNGADKWHEVYFDNKITDEDFDHASSYGWPIGESGKYTWPIHPIWCVVGSSSTKALSGWTDQKHTLSEDGTMKVEKLGHIVERGPYQDYGTVQ
jgi:hypothetical protein